jgi:solute carrier family 25 protein 39/40
MSLFISGSVAGSIACVFTHPFDVVKTLQQVSDERTGLGTLLKQYGVRGLYTGLVPRLAKIAPACGIMISSYELGKTFYSGFSSS